MNIIKNTFAWIVTKIYTEINGRFVEWLLGSHLSHNVSANNKNRVNHEKGHIRIGEAKEVVVSNNNQYTHIEIEKCEKIRIE